MEDNVYRRMIVQQHENLHLKLKAQLSKMKDMDLIPAERDEYIH